MSRSSPCICCGGSLALFARGRVLGDVEVTYLRCEGCGFVRTQEPTWLDRAYASPIAALDIGLLARCTRLADITESVARLTFPQGRFLDWAGGYGTLTRMLRDRGLDYHHHDPYTQNLFATGFEGDPGSSWDMVTAFEVLEHLTDPRAACEQLFDIAPVVLFTTELLPRPTPAPKEWWYYTPETGQHIAFFTTSSLEHLGAQFGRQLVSDGAGMHCFYQERALPRSARQLIRHPGWAKVITQPLRALRPTPSRLQADFEAVQQRGPNEDR